MVYDSFWFTKSIISWISWLLPFIISMKKKICYKLLNKCHCSAICQMSLPVVSTSYPENKAVDDKSCGRIQIKVLSKQYNWNCMDRLAGMVRPFKDISFIPGDKNKSINKLSWPILAFFILSLTQQLWASISFRTMEKTPGVDPLSANAELGTLGSSNFDNNGILTQFNQPCPTNNHYSSYH